MRLQACNTSSLKQQLQVKLSAIKSGKFLDNEW